MNQLRGHFFPLEIFRFFNGGFERDGKNPSCGSRAYLGIDKVGNNLYVRVVFNDPVFAGKPGIQGAAFNITRHLLGPADGALDFFVVDLGVIASPFDTNHPSGTFEECNGCFLQTTLWNAQFYFIFHL